MPIKISPSVLTADFWNLHQSVPLLEQGQADYLHLDVMDGVFVPNISVGFPVIESIRRHTSLPLDVHLMITQPHRYLEKFRDAGANILSIHYEAGSPAAKTLREIRRLGMKSGLAIKPATPDEEILPFLYDCDMVLVMSVEPGFGGQKFMPSALPKIEKVREEAEKRGLALDIEVDGGIDFYNIKDVINAGANMIVAGNLIFSDPDPAGCVERLKQYE